MEDHSPCAEPAPDPAQPDPMQLNPSPSTFVEQPVQSPCVAASPGAPIKPKPPVAPKGPRPKENALWSQPRANYAKPSKNTIANAPVHPTLVPALQGLCNHALHPATIAKWGGTVFRVADRRGHTFHRLPYISEFPGAKSESNPVVGYLRINKETNAMDLLFAMCGPSEGWKPKIEKPAHFPYQTMCYQLKTEHGACFAANCRRVTPTNPSQVHQAAGGILWQMPLLLPFDGDDHLLGNDLSFNDFRGKIFGNKSPMKTFLLFLPPPPIALRKALNTLCSLDLSVPNNVALWMNKDNRKIAVDPSYWTLPEEEIAQTQFSREWIFEQMQNLTDGYSTKMSSKDALELCKSISGTKYTSGDESENETVAAKAKKSKPENGKDKSDSDDSEDSDENSEGERAAAPSRSRRRSSNSESMRHNLEESDDNGSLNDDDDDEVPRNDDEEDESDDDGPLNDDNPFGDSDGDEEASPKPKPKRKATPAPPPAKKQKSTPAAPVPNGKSPSVVSPSVKAPPVEKFKHPLQDKADKMFSQIRALRIPPELQGDFGTAQQQVNTAFRNYAAGPKGGKDSDKLIETLMQLQVKTTVLAQRNAGKKAQFDKAPQERRMDLATAKLLLEFLPMMEVAHAGQGKALRGLQDIVKIYNDCLAHPRRH